jgi:hypothetical protein
MPAPLPEFVQKIVAEKEASKEDLLRAAELAADAGYPQLAAALKQRSASTTKLIPSPWKDVTSAAWTRFARVMAEGYKPASVNPKGFFGLFQLSVRRLADLGVMSAPRARNVTLPNGQMTRVWEGTWVIPQERFMTDPALQYDYFARSMDLYRNIIAEKYKQVMGLEIEGKPATLSGVLAIAHMSGSEGIYKWLTDGEIRRKFTFVTNAFNKTNGIF